MGEIQTFQVSAAEKESILDGIAGLLACREEVVFAYAHGSFLEDGPFRDLDLAVYVQSEGPERLGFHYEDGLALAIGSAFNLPFPVDLRVLNGAPVAFQYHVFRGRLLLDRDPDRRIDVVAYVLARYFDIKPIIEHHINEAFPRDAEPRSDSIQAG